MKRKRLLVALTATALLTTGATRTAPAVAREATPLAPAATAPTTTEAKVQDALRFRTSFFLDTSLQTVNTMQARGNLSGPATAALVDVDTTYGVPLTRAEKNEIDRRQGLLDKHASKLDAQLRKLGDAVPDVILDHRRAAIVVRTKLAASTLMPALRSFGLTSSEVIVEEPRWTLEQLLDLQKKVGTARKSGDSALAEVNGVGIDHDTQRLLVQTSGAADGVETALNLLLPAGSFQVESATVRAASQKDKDPNPYHAGWMVSFRGHGSCTLGVPAYGPGPKFYLLSAGHCGPVGAEMCQPACGPTAGYVVKNTISGPDDREPVVDALAIGSAAQYTHATIWGGAKMITRETHNSDHVGQVDCRLGITSGYDCGKLVDKSYDASYKVWNVTRQFRHTRRVDYAADPGDSGGPHYGYAGSTARGVIHGILGGSIGRVGEDHTFFAHIDDVLAYLGLTEVYLANN